MSAAVDQVIDRLLTIWTSSVPDGWQVIDTGPPIDALLDFLCVGFAESEQAAVAIEFVDSKAGALQRRASYEITSTLTKWDGTAGAQAVRAEIVDVLWALRAAVLADRTLGGLVTDAYVPGAEFDQDASPVGAAATLTFTTHIDVF